jgi:hypothetical protein
MEMGVMLRAPDALLPRRETPPPRYNCLPRAGLDAWWGKAKSERPFRESIWVVTDPVISRAYRIFEFQTAGRTSGTRNAVLLSAELAWLLVAMGSRPTRFLQCCQSHWSWCSFLAYSDLINCEQSVDVVLAFRQMFRKLNTIPDWSVIS